jgi:glycosyltransferase involved in cell wall biosynthesis
MVPEFLANYPMSKEEYAYRSELEEKILKRADYIATGTVNYQTFIESILGYKEKLKKITLAVGEDVIIEDYEKTYDFVYFAASISKAVDYALEAFALAQRNHPSIKLHIVGGYDDSLMLQLNKRMQELGLRDEVDFTGKLPTHHDVISEIRKAKFAVLPLKVDLIASTLREAMANGLPVVTTVTPATPTLNETRESVLLSDIGDFAKMAENMCRLMADENLSQELRNNAARTVEELYSNAANMSEWKSNYYAILKNER